MNENAPYLPKENIKLAVFLIFLGRDLLKLAYSFRLIVSFLFVTEILCCQIVGSLSAGRILKVKSVYLWLCEQSWTKMK